jgi:hypothetical protein
LPRSVVDVEHWRDIGQALFDVGELVGHPLAVSRVCVRVRNA